MDYGNNYYMNDYYNPNYTMSQYGTQRMTNYPPRQYGGQQSMVNSGFQQQQMSIIKGRPVTSREEANASMIDLDGSLFVFTNVQNGEIYTKQIMLDGSADFAIYKKVEQNGKTMEQINSERAGNEYVLKSEFESFVSKIAKKFETIGGASDE